MSSYLLCADAEDDPGVPSWPTLCRLCRASLWVSKTMSTGVAIGEFKPICHACMKGLQETDDIEVMIHPAQRQELREHGVLGWSEELVRRLNAPKRRKP